MSVVTTTESVVIVPGPSCEKCGAMLRLLASVIE